MLLYLSKRRQVHEFIYAMMLSTRSDYVSVDEESTCSQNEASQERERLAHNEKMSHQFNKIRTDTTHRGTASLVISVAVARKTGGIAQFDVAVGLVAPYRQAQCGTEQQNSEKEIKAKLPKIQIAKEPLLDTQDIGDRDKNQVGETGSSNHHQRFCLRNQCNTCNRCLIVIRDTCHDGKRDHGEDLIDDTTCN